MRLLMSVTMIGLALGQVACSGLIGTADGKVEVQLVTAGVTVRNETDLPIFYYPVERVTAETLLYLWAPCVDPDSCPRVAPGASITIPFDRVFGWQSDSREVLLYYWHLVGRQGSFEPDAIRSIPARRQTSTP